ncbi:MAG TPA: endonuclease MutS2 [Lachnospiraceae bacterium]|nr:endonuclease MutS2 [Lachnospiraceae bacterium]
MNDKVLHIVEFDKILDQLTENANSAPAKALCKALRPMDNLADIRLAQEETDAALQLLIRKGNVNFGSNRDFGYMFGALSIGSTLTAAELLHLSSFLDNVGRVQAYGTTEDGGKGISALQSGSSKPEDNLLFDLFDCLYPLKSLSREIQRCILSEEEISDDASPGLRRVRREISMAGGRIHQQLNKLVNVTLAPYLQDSVVTMRGNRYCIPIKSEYKNQVQGIIHDQSASGSTLFIEPAAIVSLNNQIRELTLQEKQEVEKVLASLSAEAADNLMALKDDAVNMTRLDFIFAKAKLALSQDATMPIFNNRRCLKINRGRHPLIDKKKVVPIDLELGEDYDLIVITGPNTGGKTVTLKTIGLFELMGMAGLHIPAGDRSELALFSDVFADIGDEQSIEQSLSTFSSHMTTIVEILGKVNDGCLCLFDELGAGTDPTEGAALAISILNYLHERGIRAVATTHYSELKVYAMNTPGVTNASCEFNVETLQPTYRLLIGVPGKSNAFAISKKLGLPDDIIDAAREQLSQETQNMEDILADLEAKRIQIQREQEKITSLRESIAKEQKEIRNKEKLLEDRREKILEKANEEARDILADAKKKADKAISELRKTGCGGDMAAMERTRSSLREQVSKKNEKLSRGQEEQKKGNLKASDLHVGDKVRVISMGLTGIVTALPDSSGKVSVRCGIMNSKAPVSDLALIEEDAFGNPVSGKSRSSMKRAFENAGGAGNKQRDLDFSRNQSISTELNLLGMTTDEALNALDKYLDDARMSHLSSVRIVHGKGTGALRKAVHNYLRRQKWVKSYRLGDFGEGDAGVTIVQLS